MFSLRFLKPFMMTVAIVLVVSSTIHAQNSTVPATQGNPAPRESANTGVYTGRDIVVSETPEQKEPEPAARSLSDGFLRNTGRHVGFSLGIAELYTPDVSVSSGERKAVSFTSFTPQLYLNFQKKKFDFRLTYRSTYERYNKSLSDLNKFSNNGSAAFSYTLLSRRNTTLRLSNTLTSEYYDSGSILGAYSSNPYQTDLTAQIYLDKRRQTRDTTAINFDHILTRRSSVNLALNYDLADYSGSDIPHTSVLSSTFGAAYRLNKWLDFNTRYTHYLNNVDQGLRGNNLQKLQFGGLSFKLGRGWVISSWGGIESTKAGGIRWMTGTGQASVSKTSGRTSIALTYHRGYSTVFPGSQVWRGDTAAIYVVQSLWRQVSIHANSSYLQGSTLLTNSRSHTVYGAAGLDLALQRNLAVSANYMLTSQNVADVSLPAASLHRYTVTLGLNYYLPSFRSERGR